MKDLMKDTVFLKVFGDSPINRVLLFMLENHIFDYSKTNIAKYSGVSRVTLNTFFDKLVKIGAVKKTRNVGRATLYQMNLKSPIVKEFAKLNYIVCNEAAEKIIEKEKIAIKAKA